MNTKTVLKHIAAGVLAVQPLFAIPVYFSVLSGSPPLWVSLLIAVAPLGVRFILLRRLFQRTLFDVPIMIFLAGLLLGLLIAPDKEIALGGAGSTLASVLIYYGLTDNREAGQKYWLTIGIILGIITLGLTVWFFSEGTLRLVTFNRWVFSLFEWVPKTGGPVLQFNSVGTLLAVVIPGLTGITLFNGHRGLRTGSGVLAGLLLAALVLSDSGGGWIAAAAGMAFVLYCWRRRSSLVLAPVYAAVAGVCTIYYHHWSWIAPSFSTGSLVGRFALWRNTVKLLDNFQSATGLGLGSWSKAYENRYHEINIHVHNSYLQQYADSGLLGLAALAAATIQFVRMAIESLRSPRQNPWYGAAVGLMGGITAGAVMAMYDVTTTVTVMSTSSYLYMSIPFIWVWGALLVVANQKLKP